MYMYSSFHTRVFIIYVSVHHAVKMDLYCTHAASEWIAPQDVTPTLITQRQSRALAVGCNNGKCQPSGMLRNYCTHERQLSR